MKRVLLIMSSLLVVFLLAACGGTSTTASTTTTTTTLSTTTTTTTTPSTTTTTTTTPSTTTTTTTTTPSTTTTTTTTTTTHVPVTGEQILYWNIGAEPQTIDPTLNGASDGGDVINQTFEGLVRERSGVVYPGIAESWEISEDGLVVTFHLRESYWSDGSELTAADFIYAWRRGMDPATASEYSWIWEYTNIVGAFEAVFEGGSLNAVGLVAPNPHTLVVYLTQRTPYIISLLSFYHFMPIKESAVGDTTLGEWAINPEAVVSNGAFVLTAYTPGDGLVLTKNDNYWNAENVHLSSIDAVFIDVDQTAYTAYQTGELDVIPTAPAALVPQLVAEDPEFYSFALLGTYYANFNMDNEILANVNVRKALSYSINREEICEALSAGQIPAQGFVPVGFIDHEGNDFSTVAGNFGMVTDDSNYASAVTLFAQGASDLGMTVAELQTALEGMTYLYNTSSGHQMVGEMMQATWEENLGFTIQLQNQDWATFQESRQNGDYDIARGGWLTDYMDPSGMLAIFTDGNAYNDPNYASVEFNDTMADAMAATTLEGHFDGLYDAQEILMADMPIIPIYYYADIIMVKDYVHDWDRSVLGTVDFTQVYLVRP